MIMTTAQSTMTEFTFAPGETDVVGNRFSPSVSLFWLKTSVAASTMRVMYKSPNTILGVIPLGAQTQTIPLRNIASVDTNTKFSVGNFLLGILFAIAGVALLGGNAFLGIILLLIGLVFLFNCMTAQLDFINQAGGRNSLTVSILEKSKLMQLANEIQQRVFADMEGIRHAETMHMQQQAYVGQMNQTMLQQQMLQAMQNPSAPAAAAPAPAPAPAMPTAPVPAPAPAMQATAPTQPIAPYIPAAQ